ncbi:MAG: carboxynorspermidine decarboxylase [Oscillospiraceae bacterium]|nr:carboxynorspermidine decarboxylase [Oscillospiraceae bacterium]
MNCLNIDINKVETPCYIVSREKMLRNMEILDGVRRRTGCKMLQAQKAFSMYALYPMMAGYLDGTTASGLYEAKLGARYMPDREVHIFSAAYKDAEFDEIARICDHIVFNTPAQFARFRDRVDFSRTKCGIRVNPLYSETETELYNPCSPRSRLGTRPEDLDMTLCEGITGLHFHTMCEQGSDVLQRTLEKFEEHFGKYLYDLEWVNFGGGHHITRADYDIDLLCREIDRIQQKYGVQVIMEPGEAHALDAGFLAAEVLDVFTSAGNTHAIIDASAACHMPDVLEMPYTPRIVGAVKKGRYRYIIGAQTCLAGDVIGEYSFDEPLSPGDRIVFEDMAIYTMCKNNTFNGMALPSIYITDENGIPVLHKRFGYEDFVSRL